jgi:hypothetical protein
VPRNNNTTIWTLAAQKQWVDDLTHWVAEHGRLPVKGAAHPADADEIRLGRRSTDYRVRHKRGLLADDLIEQIEQIPGWYWTKVSPLDDYAALMRRRPTHRTERSMELWERSWRARYDDGSLDVLTAYTLASLPGWEWNPVFEGWYQKFAEARQMPLAERNRDTWFKNQRYAFVSGELNPLRSMLMASMLGQERLTYQERWDGNFADVEAFLAEHGKYPSEGGPTDERRLAKWCTNQRSAAQRGELAADRAARLNALPGWRWALTKWSDHPKRQQTWETRFALFADWMAEHGHWPTLTHGDVTEQRMARWAHYQWRAYRNGVLEQDRIDRLNALPGWLWDSPFLSGHQRAA